MGSYIVIQGYENSNADPIVLKAGDPVRLGERSDGEGPWPNWVYCSSGRTGKSGWTPLQILKVQGETAVARADYTAREMTVAEGDSLSGENRLNGWLWCVRASDGQSGWVPESCLKRIG